MHDDRGTQNGDRLPARMNSFGSIERAGVLDAVITAGGRLTPAEAQRYGTDVKALVEVNGATLLATMIQTLRSVPMVGSITVVGPRAVERCGARFDGWVDESPTGEENVMAALRATAAGRALFCASDLPFVTSQSIEGMLALVKPDAAVAYPIFTRGEFLRAFPGARSSFFRLADGEWTGGSVLVVDSAAMLAKAHYIKAAFRARKNPAALAPLLGAALLWRYAVGRAGVDEIVARVAHLLGAPVYAIRGADPVLAMDCDGAEDIEYARQASLREATTPERNP